ncbi:MAG TPA: excisionase family DNA-binding protein [Candidatus Paceibacterota bacterium]|nr:excisionase family DNA-binding protein [Candidatus Paceibacterota bacterium]
MKNKDKKMFFSTTEVASLLKVSRIAVFQKIKKGVIKAEKIGRNYLIPREQIEQYLDGDRKLTEQEKTEVKQAVDRAIKEYGEAIRMLGRE